MEIENYKVSIIVSIGGHFFLSTTIYSDVNKIKTVKCFFLILQYQ